jgi:hypothetical protein
MLTENHRLQRSSIDNVVGRSIKSTLHRLPQFPIEYVQAPLQTDSEDLPVNNVTPIEKKTGPFIAFVGFDPIRNRERHVT